MLAGLVNCGAYFDASLIVAMGGFELCGLAVVFYLASTLGASSYLAEGLAFERERDPEAARLTGSTGSSPFLYCMPRLL